MTPNLENPLIDMAEKDIISQTADSAHAEVSSYLLDCQHCRHFLHILLIALHDSKTNSKDLRTMLAVLNATHQPGKRASRNPIAENDNSDSQPAA